MPEREQFHDEHSYELTLLHELAHSTRLDRAAYHIANRSGDDYAIEELRAEIASMMLGEELGLGHHPQNSQAYVTGWLRKLKGRSGCGTQGDGRRAANRRLADPQCDQGNRGAKRRLANRTPDDRPLPAAGRPPHLKAAQPRRSRSRWTTTTGSSSLSGPNSVETVCSTNAAETSAGSGNASDAPSSAQRRTATCCRAAPPRPGSDGPEPTPSPPSTTSHASRKRKECPSTPSSSRPPTPARRRPRTP